jgi:hypothetical protein
MKMTKMLMFSFLIFCFLGAIVSRYPNNCVNDCQGNGNKSWTNKMFTGEVKNYIWCGSKSGTTFSKAGCEQRGNTIAACEKDNHCILVNSQAGLVCKGFCGGCCSTTASQGSCIKDTALWGTEVRCQVLQSASEGRKLK